MNVAKVNKSTGIVENIEVCDQEWLDNHSDEIYTYVPYTEDNPAIIGLSWSSETGFEQILTTFEFVDTTEETLN